MKSKINWLIMRYGKQLCSIAMISAILTTSQCRVLFYQPIEPDGLLEFVENKRRKE